MNDAILSSRAAMLAALAWQIELGADEAIGDGPFDRFKESPPLSARPAAPPAAKAPPSALSAPARKTASDAEASAGLVAEARALAAAARTLDDLRASLEKFQHPLRIGGQRLAFSDGRPGARVMVVGEAPGAEEDRMGLPFVGRSGQLMDRMLAAIGLSRAHEDLARAVYIANVAPFRPPANRTPTPQEQAAFLPFLERQIALAKPEILLLAGNTPIKSLLETETGVMRMRGQWGRVTRGGLDLPALPMFHPAFLLRAPEHKRLAWRDLLSLKAKLDGL